MMGIVERLRARYMDTKHMLPCALELEAADEIERLRVELTAAQAREAKLREELGWLRNHHYNPFESTNQSKSYYRICAAIDLPADDTALQERLRAERERCLTSIRRRFKGDGVAEEVWLHDLEDAIREMED